MFHDQLFYAQDIVENRLSLYEQEAEHCTRVLRKKEGDLISVLNGKGFLYKCRIEKLSKKEVQCSILESLNFENEAKLVIGVSALKNRDRMEWMCEKLTELGIRKLLLVQCERSERTKINIDRMEKKLISAMKQSGRFYLPGIEEISFDHALTHTTEHKWIAHCEQSFPKENLRGKSDDPLILIGPEGDFTPPEISAAMAAGFKGLDLGNFRLRTETAAIKAASLLY